MLHTNIDTSINFAFNVAGDNKLKVQYIINQQKYYQSYSTQLTCISTKSLSLTNCILGVMEEDVSMRI